MKNHLLEFFAFFLLLSLLACSDNNDAKLQEGQQNSLLFHKLDSAETGINFSNNITNNDSLNILSYRNFYNGGGVGIVDINNDGLMDIFFTGNQVSNKLYLNLGNFKFEDITLTAGVEGYGGWSTGVSVVDINQDGFKDLYVGNAYYTSNKKPANELFINNGDSTFTEMAEEYGLAETGYTTHASFFDYDGDGDLDVYILNNSFLPINAVEGNFTRDQYDNEIKIDEKFKGGGDKLLRNDNGIFVDVSREAGIYGSLIGFGLGVTVGDVNGDHLQDIYVSNDFFERDYLYINQGDGTFSEDSKKRMDHMSLASMGADLADINNDGYPEIFTTEMIPETDQLIKQKLQFEDYNTYQLKLRRDFYHQYMHNALQLNTGNGSFQEIAWYAGVAQSDWSWGALMFDADMDGYNDIFVCNGVCQDVTDADFMDFFANDVVQRMVLTGKKDKMEDVLDKIPSNPQINKLFINQGNLQFESKEKELGLGQETFSNGAAYADLNNDGSLDIIVNNLNHASTIYKSNAKTDSTHFLKVALEFEKPNRDAIGAKVQVFTEGGQFYRQMMPSRGFQSSVDYNIHFGLGKIQRIDSIKVIWPNQISSIIHQPEIDTLLTLNYNNLSKEKGKAKTPYLKNKKDQYFELANHSFQKHKEDNHVDFYYEGLIMRMLSKEGPATEVIDLNNDGFEDVIIGGAVGQESSVYYQQSNGQFKSIEIKNLEYEVTAIHAFDANGDGLLDIYFGYGGNHRSVNSPVYNDQLFLQNTSGTFELGTNAIPETGFNTSVALSFDYDEDGDLDLFVGSRSVPQEYGESPKSFLFENDGTGNFKDMTIRRAKELDGLGMITDAKITDIDKNGNQNLIISGEWMGIEIFEIAGKQLKRLENPLQESKGWWNTVKTADLNKDGLPDLVLGNRGDNFYFSASDEMPVKIWLEDFDANGDKDKILTRTIGGKDMPIQQKGEMIGQLPILKKQSLKYKDYGTKSISDLIGREKMEDASFKSVNTFQTVVLLNKGNREFEKAKLPEEAQFSAIHAIEVLDINQDGILDLILAGNEGDFKPQYGKLDANDGLVLLGDGIGDFKLVDEHKSLGINGNVRSINPINIQNQNHLLFGLNNENPVLLEIRNEK